MSTEPVRRLADRLIRDGYVDNEPDALLAAIRLQLAISARRDANPRDSRPPPDDAAGSGGANPAALLDVAELMMHRL